VKLKEQHKLFADYYIESGNATESYKRAGYKAKGHSAEVAANRLLSNVEVAEYIKERNKQFESPRIANMEEVQEFWADTLRDRNAPLKDRLKASEYIAKTNAAFIEKQQISGGLDNSLTVVFDSGLDDE
jgi:phage terminase small subunit